MIFMEEQFLKNNYYTHAHNTHHSTIKEKSTYACIIGRVFHRKQLNTQGRAEINNSYISCS